MPYRKHTAAQKAEAVALARHAGAEHASDVLGIDVRTIRNWLNAAGDPPELRGTPDGWSSLFDLARARVESYLTGPKVDPVKAATIQAIAQRNREKAANDPARDDEEAWQRATERYGFSRILAKRAASRMGVTLTAFLDNLEAMVDSPTFADDSAEVEFLIALQDYHRDHGCEGVGDGAVYFSEPCPEPLDLETMWEWFKSIAPVYEWLERRREADRERDRANAKQIERAKRAWTANLPLMLETIREWRATHGGGGSSGTPREAIDAAIEAVEAWQAAATGLSADDLELIARAEAELAA